MFKFIHVADIHLGLGFRHVANLRHNRLQGIADSAYEAWHRVLRLCRDEQAAFLLVAGDTYETGDNSLRAMMSLRDGLAELNRHGIRSFVVHGNHDPIGRWNKAIRHHAGTVVFPKDISATVFTAPDRQTVRVAGVSYEEISAEADPAGLRRALEGNEDFKIALLHCSVRGCAVDKYDPYAPVSQEELMTCGADYVALGHVHSNIVLNETNPHISYSGMLQQLSISDNGPTGAQVTEVDDSGRIRSTRFVPLSVTRWARVNVEVGECESLDRVFDTIVEQVSATGRQFVADARGGEPTRFGVARLTLYGKTCLLKTLNAQFYGGQLYTEIEKRLGDLEPLPFALEKLELNLSPALGYSWRTRPAQDDFLDRVFSHAQNCATEQDAAFLKQITASLPPALQSRFQLSAEEQAQTVERAAALILDYMEATPDDGGDAQ